ncbi:MAG: hypothetical protein ACE37K_07090 [Planctomycetota bacterium]
MKRALVTALVCLGPCLSVAAQRWIPRPVAFEDVETAWALEWTELDRKPAWVERPEQRRAHFVYVTLETAKSSESAASRGRGRAAVEIQNLLHQHLQPALGDQRATKLALDLRERSKLVELVTYPSPDVDGVWVAALAWAVPLQTVLAEREASEGPQAALRSQVEWLLLRPFARWQYVEERPGWVDDVPTRPGYFRLGLVVHGARTRGMQSKSGAFVRATMHEAVYELLAPMLGKERADAAIRAGLDGIVPVRRAFSKEVGPDAPFGARVVGWSIWEISIEKVAQAAPRIERPAVRAVLEQHGR